MKRFYIECTPIRRGLTGREYLAQHIDEVFPNSKFYPLFNNGIIEFGYLEGNDEDLCNVLSFCENIFSMKRIFIEEFRGAAKLYWSAPIGIDGTATQTIEEFFDLYSIDTTSMNILSDVKSYKIKLLKEKVKREFFDYNDIVANLAKEIMLLNEYRSTLDAGQEARLDAALDAMKLIYSVDDCLDAIEEDIVLINSVMPDYYSTKTAIQNAEDLDTLNNIDIIGS
jgi:hypothetical protein